MNKPEPTVQLQVYTQVCTTWRTLIGVRFKLLALLPSISAVVIITLLSSEGVAKGLSQTTKTGVAVFGFLVTCALFVYDLRNNRVYHHLIARGKELETSLDVASGLFNDGAP